MLMCGRLYYICVKMRMETKWIISVSKCVNFNDERHRIRGYIRLYGGVKLI